MIFIRINTLSLSIFHVNMTTAERGEVCISLLATWPTCLSINVQLDSYEVVITELNLLSWTYEVILTELHLLSCTIAEVQVLLAKLMLGQKENIYRFALP